MIFYFTGTGNSYHVAKEIASVTNEKLVNIGQVAIQNKVEYKLKAGERIGVIFPVYYWGLPTVVEDFIKKLKLTYTGEHYVYAIVTCGASIGMTMSKVKKLLSKKGLGLNSAYSIIYPDNYVIMYDVTEEEEQERQQKEAEIILDGIKKDIVNKKKDVLRVKRGAAPHLLSGILHFYYKRNRKTAKFFATDACIQCGLCERICPVGTISLIDTLPQWGKECTQCLGCIHRCPVHAIQYGKRTAKRRRYVHPDLLAAKDTCEK